MGDGWAIPTVTRVSADGGFDVPEAEPESNLRFAVDDYPFGLDRVLEGVERFLEARAAPLPDAG